MQKTRGWGWILDAKDCFVKPLRDFVVCMKNYVITVEIRHEGTFVAAAYRYPAHSAVVVCPVCRKIDVVFQSIMDASMVESGTPFVHDYFFHEILQHV